MTQRFPAPFLNRPFNSQPSLASSSFVRIATTLLEEMLAVSARAELLSFSFSLLFFSSFFLFFFSRGIFSRWKYSAHERPNAVWVRERCETRRHKVPISDVISRLTFKAGNFVNTSHEVCMVRAIEHAPGAPPPRSTFYHTDAARDRKLIKVFSLRRDFKLVIYTLRAA